MVPSTQVAVPLRWLETREGAADRDVLAHAAQGVRPRRVLVAGVGYTNLSDLSLGPILAERLAARRWPLDARGERQVSVEDMSFGAVHALHWLQAHPPFDAAVFVAASSRGRAPGTVDCADWRIPRVSAEEVQQRVAEAVTGIISLDTLLTVVGYFGGLPPRVVVIDVEPRDEGWGPALSPALEAALPEIEALIGRQVQDCLA